MDPDADSINSIEIELSLNDSADAALPSEFRIFPQGTIETTKGIFKFDGASANDVMSKAKDWGNDFPLDYGHSMVGFASMFASNPAEAGKAAGWFKPVVRGGDLWATSVRWTPTATAYLKNREYRYVSPAFRADDEGRISELTNVALTNLPATKRMNPLVMSKTAPNPPEETPMKTLLVALGLKTDASETDALAALTRLVETAKQVTALTGKDDTSAALGVIEAWKTSAADAKALADKVLSLETAARDREVTEIVTAAKASGKIPPAREAFFLDMGKKDIAMLKGCIETLPVLASGTTTVEAPKPLDTSVLTPEEIKIAKATGLSVEDYVKAKAKRTATAAA